MPAHEIFVDTSAWIALTVEDDAHHEAARRVYPELLQSYRRLVTTNLVIAETYILLRKTAGYAPALLFLEMVMTSSRIEKVFSTAEHEVKAYELLKKYQDHDFSFTDAVSFVVMKERKIREAFTFDQHFRIAGYQLIP
uniref:Ribonuclease VapC n=1 Tax=Acetithermum autotrophicum TaxID=1446466 RepID=H5STH1_ACEAU|nr:hypothetical conserved protein [Candidatus Acetothermum autotrophicum]